MNGSILKSVAENRISCYLKASYEFILQVFQTTAQWGQTELNIIIIL